MNIFPKTTVGTVLLALVIITASLLPAISLIGNSFADDKGKGKDQEKDDKGKGKDQEKDDKGKGKDQEKDDKGKGKDQEKDDKGTGNTPVASENDAVDRNLGNSVLKASKDTYLRKSASDTNEGANEILRLTHIGSNRVLVAFDLSGIEGNVESATLQLFIVTNENDWKEVGQIGKTIMHQTISAHVLTRYWEEGNGSNELSGRSTGNGPGATWHCAIDSEIKNNKPDCSDKWQGGEFEGSSDEIYITNGMTGEWVEFDVTSDVIKFISGEKTNYGWLIKKDQENLHGALSFASSETDNGPRLVLERSRAPTNSSAPGNSPPAANDDSAYTNEDTPTMINVLLNDFDPDGDDLTATIADGPAHGNVTMTAPGSATYTPAPDYHGTDSFTYVVSDGQATDTATVTIVVNPVNDLPVAESQEIAVQKGTTVTITLTATDIDGDNLTYIVVGSPAHGTLGEDDGNHTITYTPAMGFVGEDGFTFKANDGNADSNIATVSIYVDGLPNQAPIAIDDTATTDEDNPVTIDVLSNDSDPDGDVISIDGITTPSHGNAAIVSGNIVYTPGSGAQALRAGQQLTDTFQYTISDGDKDDVATVTVTIIGLNDAPVANDGLVITDEDQLVEYALSAYDLDAGDYITFNIVSGPQSGTVTLKSGGNIVYSPFLDFFGNDTFTYSAKDSSGSSNTGTIHVIVNPVNDPPVALDDSAPTTSGGVPVTVDVLSNDFDVDGDPIDVISVSTPAHGTATINPDRTITYIPNPGFLGQDWFTYTISDDKGSTATAQVTVTMNLGKIDAVDDSATTWKDQVVQIRVLDNDIGFVEHPDIPNGSRMAIAGDPLHGIVTINDDGSITYAPTAGFVGVDTFVYTIYEADFSDYDTAKVTVTVVNPP